MMPPAIAALARQLVTPAPPNQAIARCLSLQKSGRLREAAIMLASLPETDLSDQAWKLYLRARLLGEQRDFQGAKSLARSAAARALQADSEARMESLPLAGAALELEGLTLRRLDQPEQARRLHVAAFALRVEQKLMAGLCESATSIGLCAERTGDLGEAERWFSRGAEVEGNDLETAEKKSAALIHRSSLLTSQMRHGDALEAARCAQALLERLFPGQLAAVSVRLAGTHALLRQAEDLLLENDANASASLADLWASLQLVRDELSAFGPAARLDLEYCNEQRDYVERLRGVSLEVSQDT